MAQVKPRVEPSCSAQLSSHCSQPPCARRESCCDPLTLTTHLCHAIGLLHHAPHSPLLSLPTPQVISSSAAQLIESSCLQPLLCLLQTERRPSPQSLSSSPLLSCLRHGRSELCVQPRAEESHSHSAFLPAPASQEQHVHVQPGHEEGRGRGAAADDSRAVQRSDGAAADGRQGQPGQRHRQRQPRLPPQDRARSASRSSGDTSGTRARRADSRETTSHGRRRRRPGPAPRTASGPRSRPSSPPPALPTSRTSSPSTTSTRLPLLLPSPSRKHLRCRLLLLLLFAVSRLPSGPRSPQSESAACDGLDSSRLLALRSSVPCAPLPLMSGSGVTSTPRRGWESGLHSPSLRWRSTARSPPPSQPPPLPPPSQPPPPPPLPPPSLRPAAPRPPPLPLPP